MAINDLYHVQLFQHVLGTVEPVITNWFYNAVDILGNAPSLADAFTQEGGMVDLINATQSHNMQNDSLKVTNLFSLTDFTEIGVPGEGGIAGEMLPVFCGVSYTKKLDTRGVRPGRVNIPGVPEAVTNISIITDAGIIALYNDLVEGMIADVVDPMTAVFDPVVIKRIPYEVADTEGGGTHTAYRLPTSLEEANFGHVVAVLFSAKVSHVVTRGNGR